MNSIVVFVILLFALVFLGWYCGFIDKSAIPYLTSSSESFIGFQHDMKAGATIPAVTPIPAYAGTSANQNISKVYDNVFYDVNNGNLIEIDSPAYTGVSDAMGTTITNLWISCRKNAGSPIVSYTPNATTTNITTAESQLPFVNSFQNFVYLTKSKNTNPYVVFYMPWNDSTFIHMIDLSNNQNIVTELYYGVVNMNNTILYTTSPVPIEKVLKPVPDTDANNNKFITLTAYDTTYSIYQLSKNLFFDVRNGQIVVNDPTNNSIAVYARNGSLLTSGYLSNKNISNTSFATWMAHDKNGAKIMLYMSVSQKTMIAIIEPDGKGAYQLFNSQRFLRTGVDTGAVEGSSLAPSPSSPPPPNSPDSMMADYYKWYYHWVSKGMQDPNSHNFNYSDDYMLKTQIVPPVCPACSTSVGTCVNCSNATNRGTVGANGTSLVGGYPVSNIDAPSNSSSVNGSPGTIAGTTTGTSTGNTTATGSGLPTTNGNVGGVSGLLYATGSGATNLIRDTGSGVADFTKDSATGITQQAEKTVTGTVGLGREIVGGTVGLGKEIVGGTVGLGKDITKGTVDLGKDIVGGIIGLGKRAEPGTSTNANGYSATTKVDSSSSDLSRGGYSNSYAGNGSSSVTDQYSYYGAVPSKGGNFMPVLSDFSKFGR
jgi:hypothetical protein